MGRLPRFGDAALRRRRRHRPRLPLPRPPQPLPPLARRLAAAPHPDRGRSDDDAVERPRPLRGRPGLHAHRRSAGLAARRPPRRHPDLRPRRRRPSARTRRPHCSNNNGARFEQIEVSEPPLNAYALFADRFAHSDLNAWTVVDEGTEAAPSAWAVVDRELRQTSNIHSLPVAATAIAKHGTNLVAGDPTWSDVVFVTRLRSFDDDAIGVLFRHADADNYYRFSMDSERGYRRLVRNVDGVFSVLWEDDAGFDVGRAYELAVVAVGPVLRGFLDGVPMFVVEDDELAAGRIGLYCWADADARFSRVQVFRPSWPSTAGSSTSSSSRRPRPLDGRRRWRPTGPSDWQVSDGSSARPPTSSAAARRARNRTSRAPTSSRATPPGATTGSRSSSNRTTTRHRRDRPLRRQRQLLPALTRPRGRLPPAREEGERCRHRPVGRRRPLRARTPLRPHARRCRRRAHRSPRRRPALPGP